MMKLTCCNERCFPSNSFFVSYSVLYFDGSDLPYQDLSILGKHRLNGIFGNGVKTG